MKITVYNFRKKVNSTARPTDDGSTFDVEILDPTNFLNPKIVFSELHENWNYAYIHEWNRYYFMSNATSIGANLWQFELTVDVLATYRTQIGNTNAFIERSSSLGLSDLKNFSVMPRGKASVLNSKFSLPSNFDTTSGTYIMTVCGASQHVGLSGGTVYAIASGSLNTVLNKLYDSDTFGDAISDEVVKTFFNPFQYILSLFWIPIKISVFQNEVAQDNPQLGWWKIKTDTPLESYVQILSGQNDSVTITLPDPDAREWELYSKAYTTYSLYIPSLGTIDIDRSVYSTGKVTVHFIWDTPTGDCLIALYHDGKFIQSFNSTIAVPVQVAQVGSSLKTAINGGLQAGAQLLTGNIVGAISTGVNSMSDIMSPPVQSIGAHGNRGLWRIFDSIIATSIYHPPTDSDVHATTGYSYYRENTLSNSSGFTKCKDAHCSIAGSESERQQIDSYLNGGFYYE